MKGGGIYVSELSASRHLFSEYHFCRGNSKKRKSRIGIILKGEGTYIYLNRKLSVKQGDAVFIPENIFCYSEWHGTPEIEVLYVSGFIHYNGMGYEPQIIECDEKVRADILKISELLSMGEMENLEAYSMFYRVLQQILPQMANTEMILDKTLQDAMEFITGNWDSITSVSEIAKKCCISESKLYHLFKKELGQTPIKFLNSIKINVATEHLENKDYSVATVARLSGFNSENHFRKVFLEFTGSTPLKYKKASKG